MIVTANHIFVLLYAQIDFKILFLSILSVNVFTLSTDCELCI